MKTVQHVFSVRTYLAGLPTHRSIFIILLLHFFSPTVFANPSFDIQTAKIIIGGGTTPEYRTRPEFRGLLPLGTRRMRLINIDDNLKAINTEGELIIEWSQHLKDGLELCKQNGWIPRLIIGHTLPVPLTVAGAGKRRYGPSSWVTYKKYVNALLVKVIDEWGFKESEWEVGNEMNVPVANWVAAKLPNDLTDMSGFTAYMTLYANVAQTVDEFRKKHPNSVIRIGGPAVPGPGYLEKDAAKNWTLRFVDEVALANLPADFVSIHIYGNNGSGNQTLAALQSLSNRIILRKRAMIISVSEWGASWKSDANVNFDPVSGAYVFEFLSVMHQANISDAIFLALSEFPDHKWPVLYARDGSPTHSMKAMQLVSSLSGSQVGCETGLPNVSCVAVKTSKDVINVLVWYLNWSNSPIDSVQKSYLPMKPTIKITGAEIGSYMGSFARVTTHSSNLKCPCDLGGVIAVHPSGVQLPSLSLEPGDYAFLVIPHLQ